MKKGNKKVVLTEICDCPRFLLLSTLSERTLLINAEGEQAKADSKSIYSQIYVQSTQTGVPLDFPKLPVTAILLFQCSGQSVCADNTFFFCLFQTTASSKCNVVA